MADAETRRIKVMISSTRADLDQYREDASQILKKVAAEKEKRVHLVEVSMEKETQSGAREFAVAVSRRWVEESDWLVAIVAWNYGTISDEAGADGLSVTEWEYQHAIKQGKKTFVFIAGDPGTHSQYRVSGEENEDLKDWISKQSREQKDKLEKFKENLKSCHIEMFANLQMFRDRLEKTLKDAIDEIRPEVQAGTLLAELIVAVTPAIRACIRQVTLIADCKQIHNHLHELRQWVIRRLREEVLPCWCEEEKLSPSKERLICGLVCKASGERGAIGELKRSITPEHDLLRRVEKVLEMPALWNVESDSPPNPSLKEFADTVDDFAVVVQAAFTEADRSMRAQERALDELYAVFLERVNEAQGRRHPSPPDDQRLKDELHRLRAFKSQLALALETHHKWQEAHDQLEVVDGFRETNQFEKKLGHFRMTQAATLLGLVDVELLPTGLGEGEIAETPQRTALPASRSGVELSSPVSYCSNGDTDYLERFRQHIQALCEGSGVEVFDRMRRPFDDAFYFVDKRTLEKVERARERVVAVESLLDVLAKAEASWTKLSAA
jgi:hypothetical protein